jgi:hypothetical protein
MKRTLDRFQILILLRPFQYLSLVDPEIFISWSFSLLFRLLNRALLLFCSAAQLCKPFRRL